VYKIDKIHGIWDENHVFHVLHIFAMRASLMISRHFLTSLKLFVEKKYLRSRRADLAWTKTQKSKKIQYMSGIRHKYSKHETKWTISWFSHFCCESSLMIAGKNLTSLRLFVDKKYLRSHRASRASSKTSKLWKRPIYTYNWHKILEIWSRMYDFLIFTFFLRELHSRSLEKM